MRRLFAIPLAAALLGAAGGCGGDPPPLALATTPEASRAALTAALDGWQAGEPKEAFARRSPPLTLGDADFLRGAKLVGYKIEGPPKEAGTGLSYVVTLTVQDGAKPPAARKVAYRVVTTPGQSVTREDGMP